MDKKTCCFIGHSDAPSGIYPALAEAVEQHICEYGVIDFLVGNYGDFDHMAARAVTEAKARHPGVSLYNKNGEAYTSVIALPFLLFRFQVRLIRDCSWET